MMKTIIAMQASMQRRVLYVEIMQWDLRNMNRRQLCSKCTHPARHFVCCPIRFVPVLATHCVVWGRQNLLIRNRKKLLRIKRGSEVFHDTIAAQMIKLQFIVNYIEQRRLFFSVWYGFQEIFPWETTTSCLVYEFLFGMHYKTGSRKKRNNVNPM